MAFIRNALAFDAYLTETFGQDVKSEVRCRCIDLYDRDQKDPEKDSYDPASFVIGESVISRYEIDCWLVWRDLADLVKTLWVDPCWDEPVELKDDSYVYITNLIGFFTNKL